MNQDIAHLERQQAEKLAEIGDCLRHYREEHSLTLEQVATKTMIQARLLRAIEAGTVDVLPEPVYIKGFIRRYAESLGLDGAELANAFPIAPGIQPIQPSWKDSAAAQLRPLHLWVAYIVVVVAAVSALSYLVSRSATWMASPSGETEELATPEANPNQSPTSDANSPTGVSPTPTASIPTPTPTPGDANQVRVDITLTSQSWLRVVVDGQTEFEGVLSEGTQQSWTATNQLTVRAGNAGGVMLAYNNGQAEQMGDPGSVKEMTFSIDQSAASLPNSANRLAPQ